MYIYVYRNYNSKHLLNLKANVNCEWKTGKPL